MTEAEYDPEKALWVPGRRRFLFLGLGSLAAAALGKFLPDGEILSRALPDVLPKSFLLTPTWVTTETAIEFMSNLKLLTAKYEGHKVFVRLPQNWKAS